MQRPSTAPVPVIHAVVLAGLLSVLLAGLLSVLLPVLLTTEPQAAVAAALLAALAAAACLPHRSRLLVPVAATTPTAVRRARPAPSGAVTDPVHHPLRPRAPGTP